MQNLRLARLATVGLLVAAVLAGCTTAPGETGRPSAASSSAEALAAHKRKQALRAAEGGYVPVVRPPPCRLTTSGCLPY
ncbi:hypothetical protein [Rhizobium sp. CC-YZS058]|uniref:hypothetical protein n=1 Tax=Rhizobium sp. CC-YZS058 TaxID=3042153 RepID=UPI002B0606AA|nr:hypothetical protein [Rhizobium sp. CC-YZS058]MEA3537203.1 hypothetical protein [Rhizobium sp. CC-YZS058]